MSARDPAEAGTPAAVIRRLALMQKLTLDAIQCGSEKELSFLVLNKTAALVSYDRATLWNVVGRCRLTGVSARNREFEESPECTAWRQRIEAELSRGDAHIIRAADASSASSALWLPLPVEGKPYAGLLLERLSAPPWTGDDIRMLRPLARAYGCAFRIFAAGKTAGAVRGGKKRAGMLAGMAIAALLALVLWRLPLRIVAPCEVVAARLLPVNTPLDGVIREIAVRPGQRVVAGDTLYVYDDAVGRQELDVSSKQVDITRSNLERAAAQARNNRDARAEAVMLRNRLSQDLIRLDAAQERMGKLTVVAPESGIVIMDDPAEFIGRPVGVGEAVVKIADPDDSLLRIRLPQDDRIAFDHSLPVRVFLNVDSARTLTATLAYVAPHASQGDDGVYGFMAEATWRDGQPGVNLGLKGTAVVYGEKVTLAYWLFRKPLAAVRRFLGI